MHFRQQLHHHIKNSLRLSISIVRLFLLGFYQLFYQRQQNYFSKMNPENQSPAIDTQTIYNYTKKTNIPWIITEYRTPKTQINAEQQRRKRKSHSQRKASNSLRYVTKRGFYMDYALKVAKSVPSTHAHGQQKSWDFSKVKKHGMFNKLNPKLIKNTFLEQIQNEQKKRKVPGVCTYKLEKSIKEQEAERANIKKPQLKIPQKIYYYQNTEALSDAVPGVGTYCPRHISPKQKINKFDHKYWAKKHRIQTQVLIKRQSKVPGPCSHSPMNTSLMTFDQLAIQLNKPSKKKCFGLDAKFQYDRQVKRKTLEVRPDPFVHGRTYEWKGKSISPKKMQWNEMIWKGHSKTIYH